MRHLIQQVLSVASLLLALACSGGGGAGNSPTPPPSAPSITSFSPAASSITSGNNTTLTAIYSNGSGVIDQGLGTVQSGVPISTGALNTTKTYTLTVSGAGTAATAQTTVTVVPSITVSVSPNGATLLPGGTQQFTATVSNTANTAVNWSVQEGPSGGSISSSGLYTAPNNSGTYHVLAAAQADPTRTMTATVKVNAVVSITPNGAALYLSATQQFTATVTGLANQAVNWSVQEGSVGGSISSSGLYTAPAVAGSFHVVATSQSDMSSSASVVLTVNALPTLSQFQTNRTDRFPVDLQFVDAGSPFKGMRANQPHQGAHIQWNNTTNVWPKGGTAPSNYPAVYAVVDGYVFRVDYKLPVGASDRYGVDIAFAMEDSTLYLLNYAIEPMVFEPSSDFYKSFIMVSPGQRVNKGDIIAYMYLPPNKGVECHVHFMIMKSTGSVSFKAPAIFTSNLVDAFSARWGFFGLDGSTPMPSCMGYMLDASENPFGNVSVDVLK